MLTAFGMNAPDSARTGRFLPLFEAAPPPAPESGDWGGWAGLMGRRDADPDAGPGEAMYIVTDRGFGTLSTSLIALGRPDSTGPRVAWRFAHTAPDQAEWRDISLMTVKG
jgi:hypothetical protein